MPFPKLISVDNSCFGHSSAYSDEEPTWVDLNTSGAYRQSGGCASNEVEVNEMSVASGSLFASRNVDSADALLQQPRGDQ